MSNQFQLRGTKDDIQSLKNALEEEFPDISFELSAYEIVESSPLDRRSHRQIELFEVVLAIGLNVASSAIYDVIKAYINNKREAGIEVVVEEDVEGHQGKDE